MHGTGESLAQTERASTCKAVQRCDWHAGRRTAEGGYPAVAAAHPAVGKEGLPKYGSTSAFKFLTSFMLCFFGKTDSATSGEMCTSDQGGMSGCCIPAICKGKIRLHASSGYLGLLETYDVCA